MSAGKVLTLSTVPRDYPGQLEARQQLAAKGLELVDPGARLVSDDEAVELVSDVHGLLVGGTHPLTAAVLEAAPKLRVVVREGIGVEKLDLGTATELGIVVSNTAGSNSASVADHTITLMLAVLRDLIRLDSRIRSGIGWVDRQPLSQLTGSTIGVVGTGNIGREVIRRAAGFDATLVAFDPIRDSSLTSEFGVEYQDTLDDLLSLADIVTLHSPLTPATAGMIGLEQLQRMSPESILINTARGALVDTDALIRALDVGLIAGAGLDAWPGEPVVESPLFEFNNVVVTPHVGGNSKVSSFNARTWGVRNLLGGLAGDPRDVVNPDVLNSPDLRLRDS